MGDSTTSGLQRHFGLLQATALNVTMIVGSGVFITIPFMLHKLPGQYALLGWLAGAALILVDGLIWSELGATLPGSGGSYVYLLESYGREKWGRLMAFLFIWQFMLSGPLEIASGLVSIATFAPSLNAHFKEFNQAHSVEFYSFDFGDDLKIAMAVGPARILALGIGILIIALLYRRISSLGRLTVALWLGVLASLAWVLIEGSLHFDAHRIFDPSVTPPPANEFPRRLGEVTLLAMYAYLGYYNVCYIGDEVKNPGKTIPRAILLSTAVVAVVFVGVHLSLLSVVPLSAIPPDDRSLGDYNRTAEFMRLLHGNRGATIVTLLLIWCCVGSAFAGMLGYARIPYGAAKQGHFFSALGKVHPSLRIPHVALLVVGALTLFWSFFDLGSVINALIVTRILEQFVAQIVGVMILRKTQPDRPRPYQIWLYPLPCFLALIGWLGLYVSSGPIFIALGLVTLALGIVAFLIWSWRTKCWPFGAKQEPPAAPSGA